MSRHPLRPSVAAIFASALFLVVVLRPGQVLGLDPDFLLHASYGKAMVDAGTPLLTGDPTVFSGGASHPVLNEWGAEVLFFLAGPGPSVLAAGLVASALVLWTYLSARRATASLWPSVLATTAAACGIGTALVVRPHLCSLVGFLLVRELLGRGRFLWSALVVSAWVNLHGAGAVLLVPLLVSCAAVVRLDAGLLCPLAATLLNPWGLGLHESVASFLSGPGPLLAADMGVPSSGVLPVYLGLCLLCCLVVARGEGSGSLLLVLLAIGAGRSERLVPFLGLVLGSEAPSVLVSLLDLWPSGCRRSLLSSREEEGAEGGRTDLWLLLLVLSVGVLSTFSSRTITGPLVPSAEASSWIRAHPEICRSPGYADPDRGGFLLGLGLVDRTYAHGLTANEPAPLVASIAGVTLSDLDGAGISWIFSSPGDPIVGTAAARGWTEVFRGRGEVILVRDDPRLPSSR